MSSKKTAGHPKRKAATPRGAPDEKNPNKPAQKRRKDDEETLYLTRI